MYNKASDVIRLCEKENKKISEIAILKEVKMRNLTEENVINEMKNVLEVMKKSATMGLETPIISQSKITGGNALKINNYLKSNNSLSGDFINRAMAMAVSTSEVNASMGVICASPTAGASGILPSSILNAKEKLGSSDEDIIFALFTAAVIGELATKNATVSGAEGGCQAECGVAASMAAAAIVEMAGGSPIDSFNAASFALINVMGLICDPVAGLVEYPCFLRNASGVVNAFVSADLALAGVQSLIPFDEVLEAMYKVGKSLPETLRETALGGIAITPAAKEIARRFYDGTTK